MADDDIYCLTPQGEQQLRGARTTLSPQEVDLLVRMDGVLTLKQIKAGMATVPAQGFDVMLDRLEKLGYVQRGVDDFLSDQFSFAPTGLAMQQANAEADAATASLKRAGYFVRIARERPARPRAAGQSLTAVVVEDEPQLAKFLQHYLQFEGFAVRVARDRATVVDELRKRPVPDLILLDVMLPDVDGFDILYRLRQHPILGQVPVIMLTAKATREAVLRGLAAGADGYVTKPFDADALVETVRTVMGFAPPMPGKGGETGRSRA